MKRNLRHRHHSSFLLPSPSVSTPSVTPATRPSPPCSVFAGVLATASVGPVLAVVVSSSEAGIRLSEDVPSAVDAVSLMLRSSLVLASEASRIYQVRSYVFTASWKDERIKDVSLVGDSTASINVDNSPKYLMLDECQGVIRIIIWECIHNFSVIRVPWTANV